MLIKHNCVYTHYCLLKKGDIFNTSSYYTLNGFQFKKNFYFEKTDSYYSEIKKKVCYVIDSCKIFVI